jgi:hypothetical protein
MNPGPTEEAGKVAGGIVDALRGQPALLVLAISQAFFLAAIFWAVRDQRIYQHEITKLMIDQQSRAAEMLAKCIIPHPPGR